ncbi:uncharacterized protein FSUBG_13431 [Fusarium subglutinans]|uniref:CCHC-type domain-containing protein n=1 Tax=Gibberella subglutinans TaxID=42677 RepID=A0A8H5KWY4_GIBSU|nr:uncharacterized protein FSUBG_13431 [Fusarium subglutinans]KAF5580278.1 hypothetical protein FSUBG_13431 [Fusarium subglutinans]
MSPTRQEKKQHDRDGFAMHQVNHGNDENLAGRLDNAEYATQTSRTSQALSDTTGLISSIDPYSDRMAQAEARRHRYDLARSTSAVIPITAGISHNKLCANCGGDGHLLANCVTAEHGAIWVCVFCKTKDHFTDACPSFKKLGLAAKVKLLVTDRAGKPQLSTHRCWCVYLHDFLVSEETKDLPAPTGFPWRLTFAEDLYKARTIHEIQEEFGRTGDESKLPKDLVMQRLEDVYLRYWKIEELPWPRRPSDMSNLSKDMPSWQTYGFSDEEENTPNAGLLAGHIYLPFALATWIGVDIRPFADEVTNLLDIAQLIATSGEDAISGINHHMHRVSGSTSALVHWTTVPNRLLGEWLVERRSGHNVLVTLAAAFETVRVLVPSVASTSGLGGQPRQLVRQSTCQEPWRNRWRENFGLVPYASLQEKEMLSELSELRKENKELRDGQKHLQDLFVKGVKEQNDLMQKGQQEQRELMLNMKQQLDDMRSELTQLRRAREASGDVVQSYPERSSLPEATFIAPGSPELGTNPW